MDSMSDQPKSIRTDQGDLIKRYHSDVKATFAVVAEGSPVKLPTWSPVWEASASPEKRWTFPASAEVRDKVIEYLDGMTEGLERRGEALINKQKLELDLMRTKLMSEAELSEATKRP